MSTALDVWLPGRRVGSVEAIGDGRSRWRPDLAWERGGQHPRLGVTFLRRPGLRGAVPMLPAWFENLLPERDGELRRRLCAVWGLRKGQSYELLARLGGDLLGAVSVRDGAAGPLGLVEPGRDEVEVPGVAGLFEHAGSPAPYLSALTGMQLKFSMSMIDHRLVLPATGRTGAWIVKLAGSSFPLLAEIEDTTMRWAQCSGFDVPEHFVVPLEELTGLPVEPQEHQANAFAIRRFDRRDDGTRVHQEDLCQALDQDPDNKFGVKDPSRRIGFDGALQLVTDVCGEPSGREMARRMGFCVAAGNGDAHLKNWSLSWGERERPVLTPCYDFVCTIAWRSQLGWGLPGGPALALRVGGVGRFAELDDEALGRLTRRTRIGWAKDEMLEGARLALAAWRELEPDAPDPMRVAVREHLTLVPMLSRL